MPASSTLTTAPPPGFARQETDTFCPSQRIGDRIGEDVVDHHDGVVVDPADRGGGDIFDKADSPLRRQRLDRRQAGAKDFVQLDRRRLGRILGTGAEVGQLQHGLDLAGEHVAAVGDLADHLRGLVGELAAEPAQEQLRVGVNGGKRGLELVRGLQHVPGPLVGGSHKAAIGRRQFGVALPQGPGQPRSQEPDRHGNERHRAHIGRQHVRGKLPRPQAERGPTPIAPAITPQLSSATHSTYIARAMPVTARLSTDEKKMQARTM